MKENIEDSTNDHTKLYYVIGDVIRSEWSNEKYCGNFHLKGLKISN